MRYTIIGCGHVGLELARRWARAGHAVTGTTTTPRRVPELLKVCAEAVVLRGADQDAVARAAEGADAVVLTVSPRLGRAFDAASRVAEYADTLVASARAAVSAHPRVVFTSSGSVYGSGSGPGSTRGSPPPAIRTPPRVPSWRPSRWCWARPAGRCCGSPTCTAIRVTWTIRLGCGSRTSGWVGACRSRRRRCSTGSTTGMRPLPWTSS
ncbi:NAD(P)H-binding protein [Nonomuraea thailandensis]